MRGFLYLTIAVFAAIGCGVAAAAGSVPSPALPLPLAHNGRTVRVEATGPCPRSLSGDGDVANRPGELATVLLPADPLFGVICWYGVPGSRAEALVHTSLVNGRSARALGEAIRQLSTATPRGIASCPAAFATAAVLAFGYANGDVVDLWYDDTGCQSLDNGYLRAFEIDDPPFVEAFSPLVTGLLGHAPAVRTVGALTRRGS